VLVFSKIILAFKS